MKKITSALLSGAIFALLAMASPPDPSPAGSQARIDLTADGALQRIRGVFVNEGGVSGKLAYRLSVRREGTAGTSTTRQSGRFDTAAGRTDTLSETSVNVAAGDHLRIELSVTDGDRLVDKAVLDTVFASSD